MSEPRYEVYNIGEEVSLVDTRGRQVRGKITKFTPGSLDFEGGLLPAVFINGRRYSDGQFHTAMVSSTDEGLRLMVRAGEPAGVQQ